MRARFWLLLALTGCSLDWSRVETSDSGAGNGGSGGAVGGSGGTTSGGSGGQAGDVPAAGAGGAGGTCVPEMCIGEPCNGDVQCADRSKISCTQENCPLCGSAYGETTQRCFAEGCFDGADVHCGTGKCGDICAKLGRCCVAGKCSTLVGDPACGG